MPSQLYQRQTGRSGAGDTELIVVELILPHHHLQVFNIYSPPNKPISLHPIQPKTQHCIIMGDFNSHSPSWGCEELGNKGEEVEYVGHKSTTDPDQPPIDPPSYYSRSWKTSTPDLAFASDSYTKCATEKPVPN